MGSSFWIVAGDGRRSAFVRNLEANPNVRVRFRGAWHEGIASVVDGDDAGRRALLLNPVNGSFLWLANPRRRMLTVRVDLD